MHWRQVLCVCVLLITIFCNKIIAQPAQYVFRVAFTDKTGSPALGNPLVFLTQRALDRRAAQNITIDSTDQPVSPAYIDSVLTLTGGKIHVTSRWFNQCVLMLTDSSKILTLQGKSFIKDVQLKSYYNPGLYKPSKGASNTTTYKTTGSQAYYGGNFDHVKLVNGDYLHDNGYKGEGMMIAVLDQGFLYTDTGPGFDSMRTSGRLKDKYNYAKANTDVFNSIPSFHGTSSLSTMAGYIPGKYVGSAPLSQYLLYVTEITQGESEIEFDNLLAASERADSMGADIITISLGYNEFNLPFYHQLTYADIDGKTTLGAKAANMATTKGMLFVASAGNEGGGWWNNILSPGDADSAITIGNTDINGNPAGNSGFGPNSAGHVKPDVCMAGQPAMVMGNTDVPFTASGTSFATPQLAGWAACLWQASGKQVTPYKLRRAIIESASFYPNHGLQLGYGIPDFKKAFELLSVKDTPKTPNDWVTVSPNPFNQTINLNLYLANNDKVSMRLTDVSGKVISVWEQNFAKGSQAVSINVPQLPAGMYFLRIIASDKKSILKLIKE